MTDANQRSNSLQGEDSIIALLAPLAEGHPGSFGLKDDCAVLTPPAGMDLVLKTDPVAEGVHFLADDAPEDVAWKALAVNASDLAAKGAAPLGYLLALSFPAAPALEWMKRFVSGLATAQRAFGCRLLGGDTDRRPGPLTVSVTLIGTVPQGKMVQRATARAGDRLFVSGTIGDAALGLALIRDPALAAAWGLADSEAEDLRRRYRRPAPRLALAEALRRHASAAMDLSDGLVKDLGRLLRASGVAGRFAAATVPLSAPAARFAAADTDRLISLLTAGDDYEVLAAVRPGEAAAFARAASDAGVAVTEIGEVEEGAPALAVIGGDGRPLAMPPRTGWDHF